MRDVITRIKQSAFSRNISVDKQRIRKLLILACYSDSESSFYDGATDYQLEDDRNDDRVLAQPGIVACHEELLADNSDAQGKENVEANDLDGLLPQALEACFERQIQVQEW